jgi:hypothetical protein
VQPPLRIGLLSRQGSAPPSVTAGRLRFTKQIFYCGERIAGQIDCCNKDRCREIDRENISLGTQSTTGARDIV